MIFTYTNSKGNSITFAQFPFIIKDHNLLDYKYDWDKAKNVISNVNLDVTERKMTVLILPDPQLGLSERKEQLKEYSDTLNDLFAYDVEKGVDGKLWTDTGYYLPCRILAASDGTKIGAAYATNEYTVVSESAKWVKPTTKTFTGGISSGYVTNQDYPYDYPYDYASDISGTAHWNLSHYSSAEAIITIYGVVTNPQITINGHKYAVYTSVSDKERLIIDTANHLCYLVGKTGEIVNCYDLRDKEESVFVPLPAEPMTITWSGSFTFDITALVERSVPKWS